MTCAPLGLLALADDQARLSTVTFVISHDQWGRCEPGVVGLVSALKIGP